MNKAAIRSARSKHLVRSLSNISLRNDDRPGGKKEWAAKHGKLIHLDWVVDRH